MEIGTSISGAIFEGPEREYRFALWRIWKRCLRAVLFVGVNPSTAAEYQDDPTVVRMVNFAKSWGYGGVFMVNLFPLVTPYPYRLRIVEQTAQIEKNDQAIRESRRLCQDVVVGWGTLGAEFAERRDAVLELLGDPVYCLGVTKDGWPKHPLYLRSETKLQRYERPGK